MKTTQRVPELPAKSAMRLRTIDSILHGAFCHQFAQDFQGLINLLRGDSMMYRGADAAKFELA